MQASWRLWTTTICNLFAGHPNGQKIHHKLGDWMAHYQEACTWKWKLSLKGSLLHKATPTSTTRAAICMQTHCTTLTFSLMVPTNQQFDGHPVMPYDNGHHIIHLPVPQLRCQELQSNHSMYYKSITAQFCTTLQPWQQPLFGLIHRHQPTNAILQTSLNHGAIILVSDASVQNSKQSSFAWVITHKAMTLWKGIGVAPGPADDIYSGRAEAFGLIAGLTFLHVKSYEPISFQATGCSSRNRSTYLVIVNGCSSRNRSGYLVIVNGCSNSNRSRYLVIVNRCRCRCRRNIVIED